jgi:hypothetical protein
MNLVQLLADIARAVGFLESLADDPDISWTEEQLQTLRCVRIAGENLHNASDAILAQAARGRQDGHR